MSRSLLRLAKRGVAAAVVLLVAALLASAGTADEVVGKRPYEMDWANRFQDDHPPLVDFESLDGWTVKTENSAASIVRTREQQLWDKYVARFTYRSTGDDPHYLVAPPRADQDHDPLRRREPVGLRQQLVVLPQRHHTDGLDHGEVPRRPGAAR